MHGYIWLEEFMYVCRILGDGEPRTAMGSPKNCRRSLESLELGFLAQVYSMLMMLLAAACFVGTCAAVLGKKKRCHERPSQEGEGGGGGGDNQSSAVRDVCAYDRHHGHECECQRHDCVYGNTHQAVRHRNVHIRMRWTVCVAQLQVQSTSL